MLDINDLRLLFLFILYSVFLFENIVIRISIVRVSVMDVDIGINGEFYYSFKDWIDMFVIYLISGVIVLIGRFDYLEIKFYEMEIFVVDCGMKLYGSSGISSMVKLMVYIE